MPAVAVAAAPAAAAGRGKAASCRGRASEQSRRKALLPVGGTARTACLAYGSSSSPLRCNTWWKGSFRTWQRTAAGSAAAAVWGGGAASGRPRARKPRATRLWSSGTFAAAPTCADWMTRSPVAMCVGDCDYMQSRLQPCVPGREGEETLTMRPPVLKLLSFRVQSDGARPRHASSTNVQEHTCTCHVHVGPRLERMIITHRRSPNAPYAASRRSVHGAKPRCRCRQCSRRARSR